MSISGNLMAGSCASDEWWARVRRVHWSSTVCMILIVNLSRAMVRLVGVVYHHCGQKLHKAVERITIENGSARCVRKKTYKVCLNVV